MLFWDPCMKMTRWQQDREHWEAEPSDCFHYLAAHTSNTAWTKQKCELLGVPDVSHRDDFDMTSMLLFLPVVLIISARSLLNFCSYFEHRTINDVIYLHLYFQCICNSE